LAINSPTPGRQHLPVVFGVDPGSRVTGYAAIKQDGNRLIHLASGVIKPNERIPLESRLKEIHAELTRRIKATSPEVLAVEAVFYAQNVRSTVVLAQARGVILLAAAQAGIPVVEYSPMEVKKAVVGYGRAEKGQVAEMLRRLFNLDRSVPLETDAADALAVALCHLNMETARRRIDKIDAVCLRKELR
jgi:crossover junction endodeoxyribonuclease RuvC